MGRKEFAHECFGSGRPIRRVIAARMTWSPAMLLMSGSGTQVMGIKFVEAGSTQSEFFCGGRGGQFAAPKGGENFTNQRCAQAVGKLAIMFFIVAKMCQGQPNSESDDFQPCGPSVGLRYAPASSRPAGLGVSAFARTPVRV